MSQKTAINYLKNNNDFAIVFDFDPDGIFSASLLLKILKKLEKNVSLLTSSPRPSTKDNPAIDAAKNFDNIITLDLAFNQEDLKVLNKSKILVIDHHETTLTKDVKGITVIKHGKKYTPTTKLVYDLGVKIFGKEFKKYDWMGVAGTIADYGGPQHGAWIEKILKKYKYPITKSPYFDTVIGGVGNVINSSRIVGGDKLAITAIKSLVNSEDIHDFLEAKNESAKLIYKLYEEVQNEIEEELERFEHKSQRKNNRILFTLKDKKHNIRSTLSTILSTNYPKHTICICEERGSGDELHGSFRTKTENVLDIINEMKKEIDIRGGGHKKAAGFSIQKEDFHKFKNIYLKS